MQSCATKSVLFVCFRENKRGSGRQQSGLSWKNLNHISSGQLILLRSQVSSGLARFALKVSCIGDRRYLVAPYDFVCCSLWHWDGMWGLGDNIQVSCHRDTSSAAPSQRAVSWSSRQLPLTFLHAFDCLSFEDDLGSGDVA